MKALAAAAAFATALAATTAMAQTERGNLLRCVVPAAPEAGRLAICTGRVGPQQTEWTFFLVGRAPNVVTRIEIYQAGRDEPRQVIDGFEARPPLVRGDGREPGRVEFVLQDVNFDRSADLRIALGPPDAEGTAYLWFLFDRDADAFAPTDAFDQVRSPIVNARRRTILGAFKDGRGRTGRMAFKWRDGKLEPVSAIAEERTDDGRCTASHYTMRDGKFEKLRETDCRARPESSED